MQKFQHQGSTYVCANELATELTTYPHKLRDKVRGLGILLHDIEGMPYANRGVELTDAVRLLHSYQATMKNGKLVKVNHALNQLTATTPKLTDINHPINQPKGVIFKEFIGDEEHKKRLQKEGRKKSATINERNYR